MRDVAPPISPSLSILLCCSELADGASALADMLRSHGHPVGFVMGVDLDVSRLDAAVGQLGATSCYVLCRDDDLDDVQIRRLQERLHAHGVPPTLTLTLTVDWQRPEWAVGSIMNGLTRASPVAPAPQQTAHANATMHSWQLPVGGAVQPGLGIQPAAQSPQPSPAAAPVSPSPSPSPSSSPSRTGTLAITPPAHDPGSAHLAQAGVVAPAAAPVRTVPQEPAPTVAEPSAEPAPQAASDPDAAVAAPRRSGGASNSVKQIRAWIGKHRRGLTAVSVVGGAVLVGGAALASLFGSDQRAHAGAAASPVAPVENRDRAAPTDEAAPAPAPGAAGPGGPAPAAQAEDAGEAANGTEIEYGEVNPEKEALALALKNKTIRSLDHLLLSTRRTKRVNYTAAALYCLKHEVEGVGGWRLPDIGELASLYAAGLLSRDYYWSRTAADAFGNRQLAWDGPKRKMSGVKTSWTGARTACVRKRE